MTTVLSIIGAVVGALAVADLRRWLPWVAQRVARKAALRFDEPDRAINTEAYVANVQAFDEAPLSAIGYAVYTYCRAPFRARERAARRVVVVGSGKGLANCIEKLAEPLRSPRQVVGFLSESSLPRSGLAAVGPLESLENVLAGTDIDEVIVANPNHLSERDMESLVATCQTCGIQLNLERAAS